MTEKTQKLLTELTEALFEKKALLITGPSGVGKTFIAKKVISELRESKYNCNSRKKKQEVDVKIVPCHISLTYEDIVGGISVKTDSGKMSYKYIDKVLVETIKKASEAYHSKTGTKYVLLFDDMQRCDISSLLGEVIGILGNGDKCEQLFLNSGEAIEVTPNFYFVGTYNTSEKTPFLLPNDYYSLFYTKEVLPDIEYITTDKESSSALFYNRVCKIILNYLDIEFLTGPDSLQRFMPGHGYFDGSYITLRIKYQIIPMLKQYVYEGILKTEATEEIKILESLCNERRTGVLNLAKYEAFEGFEKGVTTKRFVDEEAVGKKSYIPIRNLVGRIIEQKLLSADIIKSNILFNYKICYRETIIDGLPFRAALIANRREKEVFSRSASDGRSFYSSCTIRINGKDYYITGGLHPATYVRDAFWAKGEYLIQQTFGANSVLYRIVWQYYEALIQELTIYLESNPDDDNKKRLLNFCKEELKTFSSDFRKIKPRTFDTSKMDKLEAKALENIYNIEANKAARELIGKLKVLWSNPDEEIIFEDGNRVVLEGVDNDMNKDIYQEYYDAMNALKVRQLILQGPPGTSKTYSAKEFLKHMAKDCTDSELADMHITDYSKEDEYCNKLIKSKGKDIPVIAWDIVQFHPSYGYEDFIRGISVSTDESSGDINYKTVNKLLGSISELAAKKKDTDFYLIIDEINRANLATVFGELIYGLEYRKESVSTPYSVDNNNSISIPDNLYIIGTMNTADKSIGSIDYAIRRRFLFFEQLPDRTVIKDYRIETDSPDQKQVDINEKACKLFDSVGALFDESNPKSKLNSEYRREDVQIGHTYFLADNEDVLFKRFIYQIIPILKEYYKDGILSIENVDGEEGFNGFLNCITGKINLTERIDVVEKIYQKLIE